MNDVRQQPAFVVALLALLGLFSLPRMMGGQDGGGVPSSAKSKPADLAKRGQSPAKPSRDPLQPLVDSLSSGLPGEKKSISALVAERTGGVKTLIATLPNPVASLASDHFDEYLDVLQRAVELKGYALDRALLPWRTPSEKSSDDDVADELKKLGEAITRTASVDQGHGKSANTALMPEDESLDTFAPDQPGILIFREAFPKANQKPKLILVFIVPESPVTGIDKPTFVRALTLIDKHFRAHLGAESSRSGKGNQNNRRRVVHILGPCFSNSQDSIERALWSWAEHTHHPYHFRLISNGAFLVDQERFDSLFPSSRRHRATFQSMAHHAKDLVECLTDYLVGTMRYDITKLALLVESNNGLSQAFATRWKGEQELEFIFPLQVSELRKTYERKELLTKSRLARAAPERLRITPDETGIPADSPRAYTPGASAAMDEMELTQLLTTIGRRDYLAVGVVASNPLDVAFLAREVRRFCPNPRLFTIQGDLTLARPETAVELRGMLVASTYPLYSSNQWITAGDPRSPRVFFSDHGSQGLYNAAVAHLWEMGIGPESRPWLLEYGFPYKTPSSVVDSPPVWISEVGERGLYPVAYLNPTDPKRPTTPTRFLYDPLSSPERTAMDLYPGQDAETAWAAGQKPLSHLLFWVICLALLSLCFLTTAATWLYMKWRFDPDKCELKDSIRFLRFRSVLRLLGCEVAPDGHSGRPFDPEQRFQKSACETSPRPAGAGPYLMLANGIVLAFSWCLFTPITSALFRYAWLGYPGQFVWACLAWLGIIAITSSALLAFAEWATSSPAPPSDARCLIAFGGSLAGFVSGFLLWPHLIGLGAKAPWCELWLERVGNLPSGLSPVFPVVFLACGLVAAVLAQLARRGLYRASYLPSSPRDTTAVIRERFWQVLHKMREAREEVDVLLVSPGYAWWYAPPLLVWAILLGLAVLAIRFFIHGFPRSVEGWWFDHCYWLLTTALMFMVVHHAVLLVALWRSTRDMLRLAVELPISHAYDRIPTRFKAWFLGLVVAEGDFRIRKELVLRQSQALRLRSTGELLAVYEKIFPRGKGSWSADLATLKNKLDSKEGTIDESRDAVYPLLSALWDALPVEDSQKDFTSDGPGRSDADWEATWPLPARHRQHLTDGEFQILRDWARLAEDLIAIQIVRWFAPALEQTLPIMKFLVAGTLTLLLATSSYPFDDQGWLIWVMVGLIVFSATVIGVVLVGINRDELISRVSDTTPGRLTLDSGFASSLVTLLGPLLGALLAISFDVSDFLNTWIGPILRLF